MYVKGFDFILGVFCWNQRERQILDLGNDQFCRGLNGARKEIVLTLQIWMKWIAQTEEKLKRARGFQESSSNS